MVRSANLNQPEAVEVTLTNQVFFEIKAYKAEPSMNLLSFPCGEVFSETWTQEYVKSNTLRDDVDTALFKTQAHARSAEA